VSRGRGSVRRRLVIDIALGILILSLPRLSPATLAVLVAVSLLARGAFTIYVPARLRSERIRRPSGGQACRRYQPRSSARLSWRRPPRLRCRRRQSSTYPSWSKIVASVALTFFAYLGFSVVTFTAGDLSNPARSLPRAMYLALGITALVYVAVSLGVFGTLPMDEVIEHGDTALAEAARPVLGDAEFTIMAITALLATASSVNSNVFAAGNLTLALSELAQFPPVFGSAGSVPRHARSDDHRPPRPRSSPMPSTSVRSPRSGARCLWSCSSSLAWPGSDSARSLARRRG
jgi:amino acid transporter